MPNWMTCVVGASLLCGCAGEERPGEADTAVRDGAVPSSFDTDAMSAQVPPECAGTESRCFGQSWQSCDEGRFQELAWCSGQCDPDSGCTEWSVCKVQGGMNAPVECAVRAPRASFSTATITSDRLLDESGTERVSGVPLTLVALPGSTPNAATFVSILFPTVSVTIAQVPFFGYATQIVVAATSVSRPASCGFVFGFTNLGSQFTISDGTSPDLVVSGSNPWSCMLSQLLSL